MADTAEPNKGGILTAWLRQRHGWFR